MALTKNELSELVRDIISGGDPVLEGKYHPTIIWKIADTVLGGLIQESMRKDNQTNGYEINGSFLTTVTAGILEDTDRDERYSLLPHSVISLKENRGLHRISELKNTENAFSQVPNGGNDVFTILDVHYVSRKTEFYQESNRVYYRRLGLAVKKVLIKAVFSVTNLDPDQPIAIPSDMEDMFVERIIERLKIQQASPQDKSNDGNPNIPQQ